MFCDRIVEVRVETNRKDLKNRDIFVRYCIFSKDMKKVHTPWVCVISQVDQEVAMDCALAILETNLNLPPPRNTARVVENDYEVKVDGKMELLQFTDTDNSLCSIQRANIDDENSIWFGVDLCGNEEEIPARMHLTREHVKKLLPFLLRFVATGSLSDVEDLCEEEKNK